MSRHPHHWADAEVERLTTLYPDTSTGKIAEQLGIPVSKVYAKAHSLGIKKSAAYLASPEARRRCPEERAAQGRACLCTSWKDDLKALKGGNTDGDNA